MHCIVEIFVSKKEKNIQIIEEEKMINGSLVLELTIKNESLGTITRDGKRFVVTLPNGEQLKVTTQNEGVNVLIRDYHLHRS